MVEQRWRETNKNEDWTRNLENTMWTWVPTCLPISRCTYRFVRCMYRLGLLFFVWLVVLVSFVGLVCFLIF